MLPGGVGSFLPMYEALKEAQVSYLTSLATWTNSADPKHGVWSGSLLFAYRKFY